jgi:hypothetical protein
MDRRDFLIATTLAGVAGICPRWAGAVMLDRPLPLQQAATEAWLYGLMLIENAQARTKALVRARPNQLIHTRALTTPKTQSVTSPNNDTLYSRAWIDLSAGPVTLTMPEIGERYASYHFMDMYGNSFAVLGSRTTGGAARQVTIVGPNDATRDALAVRSPTRWVWLLVRLLIDGESDRAAANAIQDRMSVHGLALALPPVFATRSDAWPTYFNSVQALLMENPPPVTDLAFFKRVAPLGLGPLGGFDPKRFSAAEGTMIEAGIAAAHEFLRGARGGRIAGGWVYPNPSIGDFGQDYRFRAQIALSGLAALPPVEAMYMRPVAEDGTNQLASATDWRLHFNAGQLPPVDTFWSLTMYQFTAEGQYFFFDNPIDRYSIGDRTAGIKYGADGSLDLWISRNDPGAERRANWLPAPSTEKFGVSFRAYTPKPELLEGRYLLPPLLRA